MKILIYLIAISLASHSSAEECSFVSRDKNVEVEHYSVSATDLVELKQSMLERGPVDFDGQHRYAFTNARISWHWLNQHGEKDYLSSTASYQIKISLPCWKNVPEHHRATWSRLYKAIVQHELEHVEIARHGTKNIEVSLRELARNNQQVSLEQMQAQAQLALDMLRKRDRELDSRSANGADEGVVLE